MATVPNADTVGDFWLDQKGQIWLHTSYTALPTVILVRADTEDEWIEGTVEDEKVTSLRRLVPEEPLAAPREEEPVSAVHEAKPAAPVTNESFEIYRQMQRHIDRLKALDLQNDDIELITEVAEGMYELGKKAGQLDVDQDPVES